MFLRNRFNLPKGVILATAVVLFAGCQHNFYRPDQLPSGLTPSTLVKANDLSLSGFDSGSIRVNSIYPGDVLQVSVIAGADPKSDPNWRVRVDDSGSLYLPEIGQVRVAGMDLVQAERAIAAASVQRQIYYHPVVTVTIDERRVYEVTVDGAVTKPGTYELPASNCDLTAALLAAGGLSDQAGTVVEVRQRGANHGNDGAANPMAAYNAIQPASFEHTNANQVEVSRVDLGAITDANNQTHLLADGATITVAKRPLPTVAVDGLVKRSGKVEMPSGAEFRMLDAITLSGGVNTDLADKVHVVRKDPTADEYVVIQSSIARAKSDREWNVPLAPGDIVSVEETPSTFVWRSMKDLLGTALLGLRIYTGI